VTSGPCQFLRHPIYGAVIHPVWGAYYTGLASTHPLVAVVIFGRALQIISEERPVRQRYPDYSEYTARIKRIIPSVFEGGSNYRTRTLGCRKRSE
jgi:protein-S-isoprenylcysteine O-methyltransferase Ste14